MLLRDLDDYDTDEQALQAIVDHVIRIREIANRRRWHALVEAADLMVEVTQQR